MSVRFALMSFTLGALALGASPAYAQADQAPPQAPPVEDDDERGFALAAYGQLFAGYDAQWTEAQRFNEFTLRRAELGLGLLKQGLGGVFINTEAIRSAGPNSLFGIDQNSIIMRLKHAFAQADPKLGPMQLRLRAGLIPDVWVESVENAYDLRGADPILAERGGFFDTSDLGASISATALDRAVELRFGLTNGQGRNERELNAGKNATTALIVRPLQLFMPDVVDLALHASYRDGSAGFSSLASHRTSFALTASYKRIFAGAELIRATGYNAPTAPAQTSQDASGFGLWLNGDLYLPWLGAFGLYKQWTPDTSRADGAIRELQAGLYLDAIDGLNAERSVLGFPRLRLYINYQRQSFGEGVTAWPGAAELTTTQQLSITLSARGSFLED